MLNDSPEKFELQGEDLQQAFKRGWVSDQRFVKLEDTLVEFNNIQGMSERKNMLHKTGCRSTPALVSFAVKSGMV